MEIKYTLEILTKDIQDIGKLVENLQNSPEGSTLELDLALSKLRNVYDILSVIRTDITIPGQLYRQSPEVEAPPPEPEAQAVVDTPPVQPEPEAVVETPPAQAQPEAVVETPPVLAQPEAVVETPPVQPEPEAVVETPLVQPEPEAVVETPPAQAQPEAVVETPPAQSQPEATNEAPRPTQESQKASSDPGILADKFLAESSINENLAGNREQDVESKMTGSPIDNIGRNIGINDRFLIIRELFDGDSDGFGNLIKDLDSAGNIQLASERLTIQFENNPEHEGVTILSRLVKRKYSTS